MDLLLGLVLFISAGRTFTSGSDIVVLGLPKTNITVKDSSGTKQNNASKFPIYQIPGFMRYTPGKKHLKMKKLLRKMSSDLDKNWMSIEKPKGHAIGSHTVAVSEKMDVKIDMQLVAEAKNLNFSIPNAEAEFINSTNKMEEYFKRWLLEYSSCHVNYVWRDLSVLFWPRWVKKGYCSTKITCSWPPGMQCVPSESKMIKLLRWTCRKRKRKNRKNNRISKEAPEKVFQTRGRNGRKRKRFRGIKCKWIKVSYPLTQKCLCSC